MSIAVFFFFLRGLSSCCHANDEDALRQGEKSRPIITRREGGE